MSATQILFQVFPDGSRHFWYHKTNQRTRTRFSLMDLLSMKINQYTRNPFILHSFHAHSHCCCVEPEWRAWRQTSRPFLQRISHIHLASMSAILYERHWTLSQKALADSTLKSMNAWDLSLPLTDLTLNSKLHISLLITNILYTDAKDTVAKEHF